MNAQQRAIACMMCSPPPAIAAAPRCGEPAAPRDSRQPRRHTPGVAVTGWMAAMAEGRMRIRHVVRQFTDRNRGQTSSRSWAERGMHAYICLVSRAENTPWPPHGRYAESTPRNRPANKEEFDIYLDTFAITFSYMFLNQLSNRRHILLLTTMRPH